MRIAYFTDTYLPQVNGVTGTLNQLDHYLTKRDIPHLFFAPAYGDEPDGETVVRFKGLHPALYPECALAFPRQAEIQERLEAFGPDLVHIVTELGIGWAGLKAARALGIPVVMSYHTNFDQYLKSYHLDQLKKPVERYLRWFHGFALSNFCPSQDTAAALRARGFKRVRIWSRGVDGGLFTQEKYSLATHRALAGGKQHVALYVGRIAAEKGLDTYLEAIRALPPYLRAQTRFVFTGDGPYLETLRQSGVENLHFTGMCSGDRLAEIYASSDLLVFPSGTETFGNVGLEAMASGLPLIAADTGGVTDYTVDGENARVFRAGDPDSLSRALKTLLLNPELRRTLRAGGLKTAAQRSWPAIFDQLMSGYGKAVRTGNRFLHRQAAG